MTCCYQPTLQDNQNKIFYYDSPFGLLRICSVDQAITQLIFINRDMLGTETSIQLNGFQKGVKEELEGYFIGDIKNFTIAKAVSGSEFRLSVWEAVNQIPFGETRSYKEIAQQIGRLNSIRAVANAIANNPVLLMTPCHRVIGSDGSMTGYVGGISIKQKLLAFERKIVAGINLTYHQ